MHALTSIHAAANSVPVSCRLLNHGSDVGGWFRFQARARNLPHDRVIDTPGKSPPSPGRVQCRHYRVTANFALVNDGTLANSLGANANRSA